MVVNSKKLLIEAKKNKIAIPQFNVNNLEWAKYIIEQCNACKTPVILGFSESAIKYIGGYNVASSIVRELDKSLKVTIPLVIHLDHASSFESCKKAIDAGFTSVMIDASRYYLERNIEITKKVVEYAEKYSVTVEAELGIIDNHKENYTNLEEAEKFIKETNVDSLAPAIGTEHGIYKTRPNIDFNLCEKLSKSIQIPLVLHGASGLNDTTLKQLVKLGISKVNINTELQIAWSNELKKYLSENKTAYDPRKLISSGEVALKRVITNKINALSGN